MDLQRSLQAVPPKPVLTVLALGLVLAASAGDPPAFYPDDPICCAPSPKPVTNIDTRSTPALYDFIYNSFDPRKNPILPARGVNTLGEVIDSQWFTNRHGRSRLSLAELRTGPGDQRPPRPPFTVIGAKLEGITPGFRLKDANGDLYFVKPDPLSAPEMATAADVIGARFFYALGYNTPENYLLFLAPEEARLATNGQVTGANGKPRPMTPKDVQKVLWKVPKTADGKYRLIASRSVPGKTIGPFRYEGARSDDPNDLIPHEDRRDLRALYVFCAWLNHTDAKAGNSMDSIVEENGVPFVRHFLIDFGAILGSDSDMPKNARFGHGYIVPDPHQALRDMISFGLNPKAWETARSPRIRGVGHFESASFDPDNWTPNFPNPAFSRRLPDDGYWAAKQVLAFNDADIRAIVETGKYSDPRAVDYITRTLSERREKIGRVFLAKVLALDNFRVESGRLSFDDLAVQHGYQSPRSYEIAWGAVDPATGASTPLAGASGPHLPSANPSTGYISALITSASQPGKTVKVVLRLHSSAPPQVVGIQRTW